MLSISDMKYYWPHMWCMPKYFVSVNILWGRIWKCRNIIIDTKYLSYLVLKQTNIIPIFDSIKLVESSRRANISLSKKHEICDG